MKYVLARLAAASASIKPRTGATDAAQSAGAAGCETQSDDDVGACAGSVLDSAAGGGELDGASTEPLPWTLLGSGMLLSPPLLVATLRFYPHAPSFSKLCPVRRSASDAALTYLLLCILLLAEPRSSKSEDTLARDALAAHWRDFSAKVAQLVSCRSPRYRGFLSVES